MSTAVPVPIVLPDSTTWRGPTDGPAGSAALAGPRSAGADAVPMSIFAVWATATELTAVTRSATTVACVMFCGATTAATWFISIFCAFTCGDGLRDHGRVHDLRSHGLRLGREIHAAALGQRLGSGRRLDRGLGNRLGLRLLAFGQRLGRLLLDDLDRQDLLADRRRHPGEPEQERQQRRVQHRGDGAGPDRLGAAGRGLEAHAGVGLANHRSRARRPAERRADQPTLHRRLSRLRPIA